MKMMAKSLGKSKVKLKAIQEKIESGFTKDFGKKQIEEKKLI